jgi:hypothetical protein
MQPMQHYGSGSIGSIGNSNGINRLLSSLMGAQFNRVQVNNPNGAFDILMRNIIYR